MSRLPHTHPSSKRRRLVAATALVAIAAALLAWLLVDRAQLRAWRQAVTVGGSLAGDGAGVAGRVVGWVDHPVGAARVRDAAGLPAVSVAPDDGRRAHPVVVVLVPDGAADDELAAVQDLQQALARAGIAAWALRTPGQDRALVDDAALGEVGAALLAIADDTGTRSGRIAVAGSGVLGSLGLVLASRDGLAARIDSVLAVQPVADVQGLVRLAVTGTVRDAAGREVEHTVSREIRRAAGEAIVQAVRLQLGEGDPLVDEVLDAALANDDPIAALAGAPSGGLPELRAAQAVLRADGGAEFDRSWARLPAEVRAHEDARSPLAQAHRIDARVLLVVPEDDRAWPTEDVERLERVLRDARLHRTRLLDPDGGVGALDSGELRRALGVGAWWLRRAGA